VRDERRSGPLHLRAHVQPGSAGRAADRAGSEFNIVLGLCVGHDSLFFKFSKGLATTLVAKDASSPTPDRRADLAETLLLKGLGAGQAGEAPVAAAEGRPS